MLRNPAYHDEIKNKTYKKDIWQYLYIFGSLFGPIYYFVDTIWIILSG